MYSQLFDDYMNMESYDICLLRFLPFETTCGISYGKGSKMSAGNRETRRVGSVGGWNKCWQPNPEQTYIHMYIYIYVYIHICMYIYIYISISIKQPLYDYGWMGLFLNVQTSIVILISTHTHTLKTHSLQFQKTMSGGYLRLVAWPWNLL